MKPTHRRAHSLSDLYNVQPSSPSKKQQLSPKFLLDVISQVTKSQPSGSAKSLQPFLHNIALEEEEVRAREKKTQEYVLKEMSKIQTIDREFMKQRYLAQKTITSPSLTESRSQPGSPLSKISLNKVRLIRMEKLKTPNKSPPLTARSKHLAKIQNFMPNPSESPIKSPQNIKQLNSELNYFRRRASIPELCSPDEFFPKSKRAAVNIEKSLQEDYYKEFSGTKKAGLRADLIKLSFWKQDLNGFKKEVDGIINSFPHNRNRN
ncbi:unnamed protein product [Blepharisma stoltei]|uniref:Uncharacterized protein n=1 Tax=Blepharisma stoltei TaxID=1481888 RepID=A0AAU9K7I9_9CILI|nr:unnamed protein product [Blepharisma stoltei]